LGYFIKWYQSYKHIRIQTNLLILAFFPFSHLL
jgi:hypothetical protein